MFKSLKMRIGKGFAFVKKHRWEISGVAALAAGLIMLGKLFEEVYMLNTRITWAVGIVINVLLGLGLCIWLRLFLNRCYGSWLPQDVSDYYRWREALRKLKRGMTVVACLLFAAALGFFLLQMYRVYYFGNLSMGYLLMATVLIQYGLCHEVTIRFMNGLLDSLVEAISQVSQERLAAAVEMERQSIEQTARSERLKVDLISNVSHDLKTPLTSMVGYIELLKKEPLEQVSRDYVNVISDKAEKLKGMIESLFNLAKVSSGNVQLTMETVELNMLIEQLFADMEDKVEDSGLNFVQQLTEADTRLVSDNIHLYRICQNLLENALKYSARGTRVFVKTWVEQEDSSGPDEANGPDKTISPTDQILLEITNTASYMMDFEKEDIIERFARGDKTRSSDGNGLGLAIVSTYTGALGGDFDIKIDCDQFKVQLKFPRGKIGDKDTRQRHEIEHEYMSQRYEIKT